MYVSTRKHLWCGLSPVAPCCAAQQSFQTSDCCTSFTNLLRKCASTIASSDLTRWSSPLRQPLARVKLLPVASPQRILCSSLTCPDYCMTVRTYLRARGIQRRRSARCAHLLSSTFATPWTSASFTCTRQIALYHVASAAYACHCSSLCAPPSRITIQKDIVKYSHILSSKTTILQKTLEICACHTIVQCKTGRETKKD